MGKASFNKDTSTWILHDGEIIEGATLDANVAAKIVSSTGNLETIECNESLNSLEVTASGGMQWHVNMDGQYWWTDPNNQVWGTERTGGSGIWGIYKQANIYTTARKYAGKNGLYGILIYREPNIGSGSTWGGISIYPPEEQCAKRGHRYRFSFDYRGYSNGNSLQVYQNYTVGWGDMGIGLPGAWSAYVGAFDTDWEWRRYEYEFDIQDSLLDFIPGSNKPAWDPNTQYAATGWYAVTYDGYVYRHHTNNGAPTRGVTPDQEYGGGRPWDWRVPMTPGYMSIYNNIKIGFSYETQGTRGTHVYVDNIQLTDITDNKRWKYGSNGWEADNYSDAGMHVFAKGTAYVTQDKGDGADKFACEGGRVVRINGTDIGVPGGRGLVLSRINALNGDVISQDRYDTYGVDADRTALADALAEMTDDDVWILTSFDAINPNTSLDNQMRSMGSVLLVNDGEMYSVYTGGGVRHPYAAVGRGQRLIKEDGGNAYDTIYKRKGVIDIRI